MNRREAIQSTAVATATLCLPTTALQSAEAKNDPSPNRKKMPENPVERVINLINVGTENRPATSADIDTVHQIIKVYNKARNAPDRCLTETEICQQVVGPIQEATGIVISHTTLIQRPDESLVILVGTEDWPATNMDIEKTSKAFANLMEHDEITVVTNHRMTMAFEKKTKASPTVFVKRVGSHPVHKFDPEEFSRDVVNIGKKFQENKV